MCQNVEKPQFKEILQVVYSAKYLGEALSMDFVGPLPKVWNGVKYIVTIVDHLSGWVASRLFNSSGSKQVVNF